VSDEPHLGRVMTQILLSVERANALLVQANELHGEVVQLLGEISNAAADLEKILERAAADQAPPQS
jgi:hypothetical protein